MNVEKMDTFVCPRKSTAAGSRFLCRFFSIFWQMALLLSVAGDSKKYVLILPPLTRPLPSPPRRRRILDLAPRSWRMAWMQEPITPGAFWTTSSGTMNRPVDRVVLVCVRVYLCVCHGSVLSRFLSQLQMIDVFFVHDEEKRRCKMKSIDSFAFHVLLLPLMTLFPVDFFRP